MPDLLSLIPPGDQAEAAAILAEDPTLAAILHARAPDTAFTLKAGADSATLSFDGKNYSFPSRKGLNLDLSWPF